MMKKILLLSLMIGCSASFAQRDLTDGLVMYYPFNGNCNDESGNGNHGSVFGPVLCSDQSGNENSAFEFDGMDDYIDPVYPELNSQSFSFCVWFKSYGFDDNQLSQSIFGGRTGTTTTIIYNMVQWQNYDSLFVQIKGNNGGTRPTIELDKYVLDNQWHFWSVTSDTTSFNFYLDGSLFESVTQTTSGDLTINALIGAYYHNSSTNLAFFKGVIDEVRIYNRALNEEEINTLYKLILSTSELDNIDLVFYPNPANNKLNIELGFMNNHPHILELYNIAGEVMLKQYMEKTKTTIDISELSNGLYFVQMKSLDGEIVVSRKFIKN